jgi:nicotinamidase-related amidase
LCKAEPPHPNPYPHSRYAEGALKTKGVDSTRSAISSLLEKYRSAGDASNLVHVVHSVPEGAPVFTPNTRLAAEFDELTPKQGEKVISKQHPGSFAGTDLDEYLGSLGDKGELPPDVQRRERKSIMWLS